MMLSFSLIGLSVGGLALTPGYAKIGVAAPVLAVLFRLLQGFALGGEVDPSTALLLESAPVHRRGFYVSLQAMSADGAVMVAGLVGVLTSATLDQAAANAWGWRLALLLGLAILPFALTARRTLVETLAMEETLPPRVLAVGTRRIVVLGLCMLAAATIANYVLVYLGTWATTTLGIVQRSAFASVMLVGLGGVVCDPLSGWAVGPVRAAPSHDPTGGRAGRADTADVRVRRAASDIDRSLRRQHAPRLRPRPVDRHDPGGGCGGAAPAPGARADLR